MFILFEINQSIKNRFIFGILQKHLFYYYSINLIFDFVNHTLSHNMYIINMITIAK
jgi:hypothetical protein